MHKQKQKQLCQGRVSLVELVDAAVDRNNQTTAMAFMSIQADHGRISNGWMIDCSIEPLREGHDSHSCSQAIATFNGTIRRGKYLIHFAGLYGRDP
jgi:hypothetical protein